ncbi:S1/P1 nuclease [Gammaproteobacteria bacterium]|nr:S1/P1 nuclease [Gammaproteobacteria bacterium]
MIKNSLLTLVLMISFNANAWWDTGHEMVCSEAYNLLSPAAKKAVDPLSEVEGSFERSCLWADWVKRERRETGNWHYINLSDDQQDVSEVRCPENGCLIQAFHDQVKILRNSQASFLQKQEALWFIGHFVGDIHQPMHAGYPEDLGGNRHQLELPNGTKTNMHKVWDGQIIEYVESKIGKKNFHLAVKNKIKNFLNQEHSPKIENWAQESRDIAMSNSVGYRGAVLKVASNDYMETHGPIVQDRIALGAIRLSNTLNSIFDNED